MCRATAGGGRGIKSVIGPAIVRGTVVKRLPKFAPCFESLGAELFSDSHPRQSSYLSAC